MGVGERLACRIIAAALRDRVSQHAVPPRVRLLFLGHQLTLFESCRASTQNLFRSRASSTGTCSAKTRMPRQSRQTARLSWARRSTPD